MYLLVLVEPEKVTNVYGQWTTIYICLFSLGRSQVSQHPCKLSIRSMLALYAMEKGRKDDDKFTGDIFKQHGRLFLWGPSRWLYPNKQCLEKDKYILLCILHVILFNTILWRYILQLYIEKGEGKGENEHTIISPSSKEPNLKKSKILTVQP